jgi:hypothetical protein
MRRAQASYACYMPTCACMNTSAPHRHSVNGNSPEPDRLPPSSDGDGRKRSSAECSTDARAAHRAGIPHQRPGREGP